MKVYQYMASTINGIAAKNDGDSNWVTDSENFNNFCRKIGCVIMGKNTFDIFNNLDINEWPNNSKLHIILTSKPLLETKHPNINTASSPQEAIKLAERLGYQEIVVIGGSHTFGSFLKENLVDELFIDIEPLALGEGMPLFIAGEFEIKLKLLETKQLEPQAFQLHYQVLK